MQFHHIGLAVKDITHYYETYLKPLFGFTQLSEIEVIEKQVVKIAFAENKSGVRIELIEPLNEESPVIQVLERRRGGLYHLGFWTENFTEDLQILKQKKFIVLSNKDGLAFLMSPTFDVYELMDLGSKFVKESGKIG